LTAEHEILAAAPIGILFIDTSNRIQFANPVARDFLDCDIERELIEFIHPDFSADFEVASQRYGEPHELKVNGASGTKTAEFYFLEPEGNRHIVFLTDVTEKVALGRQLLSTRQPSRKNLAQLQTANTTMMGYAELIAIMLEEEEIIAGERLTVIRRYHREIRKCIETIERLLKVERNGGRRPDAVVPMNRRHVVVIDDEAPIAEFIAELMRGMQYKVTVFSSPREALGFCKENLASIDLVICDDQMPELSGSEIASAVHAMSDALPVVLCSEREPDVSASEQTFLCHKPIDINELTKITAELV
jgi:CheY-like chemotaxis protein